MDKQSANCTQCGTPLPAAGAICPGCLILGGLEEETVVNLKNTALKTSALPDQIGPYRILKKIGQGGTAEVFLAQQSEPIERQVAFKLIRPGMDSEQVVARFAAERQVLSRLQHPSIATVLDAGTTDNGRPYFVMEFVDGLPVSDFVRKENPPLAKRLQLFLKICEAVQHAHQRGIVHRDLKPSNILIGAEGEPKVIDFGIARALEGDLTDQTLFLTREGDFLGTPAYMSPEQARGEITAIDTRTDVYALGVILYELLTNQLPFDSTQIRQGITTEARKPSSKTQETQLRGDLDWIALKALALEKERRYSGVAAFAEDIQRHLNHEPVTAGPPTATYRLTKFVRRNRGLSLGLAIATLAIISGAIISFWQASEAKKARLLAEQAEQVAKDESAISLAINQFLIDDLFSAQNYENVPNPNITILELVDQAAGKIDQRFPDTPPVASALHLTIGNTYQSLGRYDESIYHFQKSRTLTTSPLLTRQLIRKESVSRYRQRQLAESRKLLEEFLTLSRKDGVNEEDLIPARMQLAGQLSLEGKLMESIELQVALIEEIKAAKTPDPESLRQTEFNLALNLYNLGQYDQATPLLENFLAQLESQETLNGANAMTELATCYHALGRSKDAEAQLLRALEIENKILPETHPQTLNTKGRLASLYDETERIPQAIKLYREIIAISMADDSQSKEEGVVALHNLSLVLMTTDLPESEKLMRQAIAVRTKLYGLKNPQTIGSRYNLGNILRYQNKLDEAAQTHREVHHDQTELFGANHPNTLWTLRLRSSISFQQNKRNEALDLARQLLKAPLSENKNFAAGAKQQKQKLRDLLEKLDLTEEEKKALQ